VTISSASDWNEATASGRNLVLNVVASDTPLAVATPPLADPVVPNTTTGVDISDFEVLLTSQQRLQQQQQQQQQQQEVPTREPDTLPFLSASETAASASASASTAAAPQAITDQQGVDIDSLPLRDRLETLLVELVFSGEHVIDEVVAALHRASANIELTAVVKSLELFLAPARESLRTGGAKACGLFADLQEQASHSMLVARIASVISLAVESVKREANNVSQSASPAAAAEQACSAAVSSFNVREQISNIVRSIETHPDVQTLIDVIKEKLQPLHANKTSPTTAAPEVVAAEFVADVTVPDDSQLTQYDTVTKTWRVRNSGNVTWPAGICLVGTTTTPIAQRPMPGTEIEISALLRPTSLGRTCEYYDLCDAQGNRLLSLWARFECVAPPNPALTPESMAQLRALGFPADVAEAALVAANGNLNLAIETLLSSSQL
jgi:hypothetical protein